MSVEPTVIAMGKRLRSSTRIRSVGVLTDWDDYPPDIQDAIRSSDVVFYPSVLYEDVLRATGKRTFPRNYYRFMGNKILQTQLFQLLGISHPRTRLYYGKNLVSKVTSDFQFPFIAKNPLGSSKGAGVHFIRDEADLLPYLEKHRPAYIQEYLPIDRDLRIVLLGGEVIHAYWRIQRPGEFRCNVARGASISFEGIPVDGLAFAREVATRCGFEEVGMDVCHSRGRYYILEANMVFGLEGFRQADIDIHERLSRAAEELPR